jgi:hypothetical protein
MKLSGAKMLVVASLAVLAACGGDPTGIRGARMDLVRARALWDARGSDDYRMTVRLTGAWIGGAAVIQVRDGVPVSVQPVGSNDPLPAEMFRDHDTIEELFGIVQRAVDEDAFRIDAEYHTRFGVPVDVFIDLMENAVDEEHGFIVEAFDLQ